MADLLKKEHYDLMEQFEREHTGRFGREDKALWPKGIVYQDGRVNELFLAYRRGYAYARVLAYGDGFHDGQNKGFKSGYGDALADVKNELQDVIDAAIKRIEERSNG